MLGPRRQSPRALHVCVWGGGGAGELGCAGRSTLAGPRGHQGPATNQSVNISTLVHGDTSPGRFAHVGGTTNRRPGRPFYAAYQSIYTAACKAIRPPAPPKRGLLCPVCANCRQVSCNTPRDLDHFRKDARRFCGRQTVSGRGTAVAMDTGEYWSYCDRPYL